MLLLPLTKERQQKEWKLTQSMAKKKKQFSRKTPNEAKRTNATQENPPESEHR